MVLVGYATLPFAKQKKAQPLMRLSMAGETRFEHATCGFGGLRYSAVELKHKEKPVSEDTGMAGETRFEHATYGFGDRYSTVELLP